MADTAAVAAHGLTKSYGRRRAIERVTFEVQRGQICGLLGPNGAGKTTTMRVLVGLSRPDNGTARLLGEPSRLSAGVLALTIDGPVFVPHLSGRRNLELAWRAGAGGLPRHWRRAWSWPAWARHSMRRRLRATRWACASGSCSLRRSWAAPSCSSWTSRPTASTPARSARSAST
jgi:energy-coupling factor transporter ATP-binding protein EcfA2